VKKHQIKRVFLVSHWLIYWCFGIDEPVPQCNLDNMKQSIEEMMGFVNQFQKLGAEIAILTIDFDS
jgi:hypothetical protein